MGDPEPNLVRDLHDSVARSLDLTAASTRPARTTPKDMSRMVADVMTKLEITPAVSVIEIGCGVGVLALPIAHRVQRYVGLDFAEVAVARLQAELAAAGLADRASAESIDFLEAPAVELGRLGKFDRVLMYAVLHYARNDDEGARFVSRATEMLLPGGIGLIGNLPLEDLAAFPHNGTLRGHLVAKARWMLTSADGLPHGRLWRVKLFAFEVGRRLSRRPAEKASDEGFALPAGYTLALTRKRVEAWLRAAGPNLTWTWLTPAIGVPLHRRADLLIRKAA